MDISIYYSSCSFVPNVRLLTHTHFNSLQFSYQVFISSTMIHLTLKVKVFFNHKYLNGDPYLKP